MRGILLAAAAAFIVAGSVSASGQSDRWSIKDMNRAIESTNFVVNGGCAGTLISLPHRLVLTNFHCIERNVSSVEREVVDRSGAVRKVKSRRYVDVPIAQYGYDGFTRVSATSYVTEVVAEERRRDLALLRIRSSIPHTYASQLIPEGTEVARGERVYIVGNPLGEDATLGEGIVSRLRTVVFPWAEGEQMPVVQHSAGSAGGNSGGALYNARGQMIGVPAASYAGAGHLGFAIAADVVRGFLVRNCWSRALRSDAEATDMTCEALRAKTAASLPPAPVSPTSD